MDGIHGLIGSDAGAITWWQMSIRAVFIFFGALVLVRFSGKRIFGKNTSFDIVLGVILGSILSRALTANARFFPTLAAAATLVLLHRFLAKIAFRSKAVGHLIKGVEAPLITDGNLDWQSMQENAITEHDLKEAARIKGSVRHGLEKGSGGLSGAKRRREHHQEAIEPGPSGSFLLRPDFPERPSLPENLQQCRRCKEEGLCSDSRMRNRPMTPQMRCCWTFTKIFCLD